MLATSQFVSQPMATTVGGYGAFAGAGTTVGSYGAYGGTGATSQVVSQPMTTTVGGYGAFAGAGITSGAVVSQPITTVGSYGAYGGTGVTSQVVSQPMTTTVGGYGAFAGAGITSGAVVSQPITTVGSYGAYGGTGVIGGGVVSQPMSTTVGSYGGAGIFAPSQVMTAPATTFAQSPTIVGGAVTEIDQVNAFGQVVERDFIVGGAVVANCELGVPVNAGLNGVARVIGTNYAQPVVEIDQVNQFGQVVERDFVGANSAVTYAQPTMVSAPMVSYGQPTQSVVEFDQMNQFGQVVERDFVGVNGAATYAQPTMVSAPMVSYGQPTMVSQSMPAYGATGLVGSVI